MASREAVARRRALERDLGEIQRRCGRDALRRGNGRTLPDCRRKHRPDWKQANKPRRFWLADYGCWVDFDEQGEVVAIQEVLFDLSDAEVMDDALELAEVDADRFRHWTRLQAKQPHPVVRILRGFRRVPRARSKRVRRGIRRRGPPARQGDDPEPPPLFVARLRGLVRVLGGAA